MSKISLNEVVRIGEKTACMFLVKRGFRIIEQNYWKKWGEIDIIAKKLGLLHFIEVKTVSREISGKENRGVARETGFRPEENVHPQKLKRLHRAIFSWLEEYNYEKEWQIDVAAVYLDTKNQRATVRMIENVIFE